MRPGCKGIISTKDFAVSKKTYLSGGLQFVLTTRSIHIIPREKVTISPTMKSYLHLKDAFWGKESIFSFSTRIAFDGRKLKKVFASYWARNAKKSKSRAEKSYPQNSLLYNAVYVRKQNVYNITALVFCTRFQNVL